jgi:predicted Zn-dependent peptidase
MLGLKDTVTKSELDRAKKHLKGNLILGLESTSSRMNNIARQEIYFKRHFSPEKIMRSIDAVTLSNIKDLAERLVKKELFAITAYGDLNAGMLDGILH